MGFIMNGIETQTGKVLGLRTQKNTSDDWGSSGG